MKKTKLLMLNLTLFAEPINSTTSENLSPEMKTYYDDYMIDIAGPNLVHDQFGQKHPIPKNGGKTIEFRKYDSLGKSLTPLTEGVTPDGQALKVTTVTATVAQYGGWVPLTDMLLLTAIDNNLVQAVEALGQQAGETLDTVVREVLNGGTSVQYAEGQVTARNLLQREHKLTVDCIKKAVRFLKTQHAQKINGSYIGIIHPDCEYDLTSDPEWKDMNKYTTPELAWEGEIGRIAGVRFVETSEAKVWAKAGKQGSDGKTPSVYSTLILGKNAYGVTEITGGGLQTIIKQLGSGGTADPLNQRASAGWKATKTAERLVEQYMVRIETTSTYDGDAN